MRLILLFYYFFIPGFTYCQSIDSIRIGSGGGITGKVMVYKVANGKVHKGKGLTYFEYFENQKLSKQEINKIFCTGKKILKNNSEFSYPYNYYYFLELFTKSRNKKYTWGDPKLPPPAEILNFYNQINTICNHKFKK